MANTGDWSDLGSTQYQTNAQFKTRMDGVFGAGKWRDTGDYRTPERENQLRAQGAQTARGFSDHSLGTKDASGAHDIVVQGMSPGQVADRLKQSGWGAKTIAEGPAGGQGAHLHVSAMQQSDGGDWSDLGGAQAEPSVKKPAAKKPFDSGPHHAELRASRPGDVPEEPTTGFVDKVGGYAKKGREEAYRDFMTRGAANARNQRFGHLPNPLDLAADVGDMFEMATGGFASGLGKATVDKANIALGHAFGQTRDQIQSQAYSPTSERQRDAAGNLVEMAIPGVGEERAAVGAGARVAEGIAGSAARRVAEKARMSPPLSLKEQYGRAVGQLKGEGVVLTPWQERGGEAARQGSAMKANPFFSKAHREAEDHSIDTFNVAGYNRILSPIGIKLKPDVYPSREAFGQVEKVASSVYERAKPGIRAEMGADEKASMARVYEEAKEHGENERGAFDAFMKNKIDPLFKNGALDGDGYIKAKSILSARARSLKGAADVHARDAASTYEDALNVIMDSAERHSSDRSRQLLKKANTAWAALTRVQEAVSRRAGGLGKYSPHDLMAAIRHQTPSVGGRRPAFARGDALLQDLAESGMQVLPDRVPASDTAEKFARNPHTLRGWVAQGVGAPITNAIAGAALKRHAADRVSRMSAAGPHMPVNNLKAILRRTSPAAIGRGVGGVNTLVPFLQGAQTAGN